MKDLHRIKVEATKAVITEGRLIADVASEFGISQRKLYFWLKSDSRKTCQKAKVKSYVASDSIALDLKLRSLQNEVEFLRTKLSQYQIIESLENGRIGKYQIDLSIKEQKEEQRTLYLKKHNLKQHISFRTTT